jgi:hypothetical protein
MVAKCGETWLSSARWGERPGFLANNSTGTLINLILTVLNPGIFRYFIKKIYTF